MSQLTKKAIIQSFVGLLNQMPLDKITVKDIVDDCGVNRGTFYYYFQDIYALLEEVFDSETQKVADAAAEYPDWTDGFLQALSFVRENKRAVYHVFHSIDRALLEKHLCRVVGEVMQAAVRTRAEGVPVTEEDICLISDAYTYTLVGVLLAWLQDGMRGELEDKVRRLSFLMDDAVRVALDRAAGR
ncbi:MAG: TetR/AcrR family transcriptional regulator [Clostridiaceae bacterium]|nr:TetR/AcrR family transcriptional regulator [Clostridiaceae bacterium]